MRATTYALLVALLLPLVSMAQTDTVFTIKGVLFSAQDSTPLPQVNLAIYGTTRGTSTNDYGYFVLNFRPSDTIVISAMNFELQAFTATQFRQLSKPVIIYLQPKVYGLDEVIITDGMTKQQIRDGILGLKLPPDPYEVHIVIPNVIDHVDNPNPAAAGGIGIPWDFRANKVRKQHEEVNQWMAADAYREMIAAKYNKQVIQKFVAVPDEEVDAFIKYCELPDMFIEKASEYELAVAIKDCYVEYNTHVR